MPPWPACDNPPDVAMIDSTLVRPIAQQAVQRGSTHRPSAASRRPYAKDACHLRRPGSPLRAAADARPHPRHQRARALLLAVVPAPATLVGDRAMDADDFRCFLAGCRARLGRGVRPSRIVSLHRHLPRALIASVTWIERAFCRLKDWRGYCYSLRKAGPQFPCRHLPRGFCYLVDVSGGPGGTFVWERPHADATGHDDGEMASPILP